MSETRSVCGDVESRVATLVAAADANAACIAEEISSRVKEAVEYFGGVGVTHCCGRYPATGKGNSSNCNEHCRDGQNQYAHGG